MIPFDYITEWRAKAPWIEDAQVEQDMVISRALVEIFANPVLADSLALRGGTALSKLHVRPPARYSEDIDLVQTTAGPAGPMMQALRTVLEPWLDKAKWKQGEGRITFYFRFTAEGASPVPMKLKVEINTREHFALYGLRKAPLEVVSRWFTGVSDIRTYELDELLATKLRALYQRKQARDLFDLGVALTRLPVDPRRIASAFVEYMAREGHPITRAQVEQNLALKMLRARRASSVVYEPSAWASSKSSTRRGTRR